MTETDENGERKEYMSGLEKGLDVLLAFDREHPQLTLSEVAERTSLSPSTARRCLLTFQELGYVGSYKKRFFLRPKVLDLGAAYLDSTNIEGLTKAYLTELATETGDSASLSVLDGCDIVYLAHASARTLLRLEARVGSRFPAYATSMGRVMLAGLPEDRLDHCLSKSNLIKFTEKTETDPEALKTLIARCREDGFSAVEDELAYGVVAVAVPVRDSNGRVVAAVNTSGHSRVSNKDAFVRDRLDLLRAASQKISGELRRFPAAAMTLGG